MFDLADAARIVILTLTIASILTLAGCGGGGDEDTFTAQPSTGALPATQVQR